MSVRIETPATAAPMACEPVSPMKIWAGEAFHHRKPAKAPTKEEQKGAMEEDPGVVTRGNIDCVPGRAEAAGSTK